tara:strand:+ start:160 stop:426 length:267 start_codon:yes stop_codon:yes gene_type:complete
MHHKHERPLNTAWGSRRNKRQAGKSGKRKSNIGIKISNIVSRVKIGLEEKLFSIYLNRQKKKAKKKKSSTGYIANLIKENRKNRRRNY